MHKHSDAVTPWQKEVLTLRLGLIKGVEPKSLQEVASLSGLSSVTIFYTQRRAFRNLSLPSPTPGEWRKILRQVTVPSGLTKLSATRDLVAQRMRDYPKATTDEEKRVLTLRFGLKDNKLKPLAEVAEQLGMKQVKVRDLHRSGLKGLFLTPQAPSIWVRISRKTTLSQELKDFAPQVAQKMEDFPGILTARAETVVRLRFGLTEKREYHTLGEIKDTLKISREWANKIIASSLEKLFNPDNS